MSARMEYKGTDVEEAIANACQALNVAREQLEITIVSTGSTGIFGLGRKKAVVAVTLKGEGRSAPPAAEAKEPAASLEKPRQSGRPPRAGKEGKPASAPEEQGKTEKEGEEPEESAVGDPVSAEEMEEIKKDLARILELMGAAASLSMEQDAANKVLARIEGEGLELLIGPEGQTLDALEYLLRKIITRKFPQKVLFALDAGGFRANRREELQERALRLAQEVKETGKTRTIPAINPAERRIVHMALQNDTEIRSRSVGDGVFKKVLIYLPGKGGRKRSSGKRRNGGGERTASAE
jgi:spoIIIJ-associated protein